MKKDKYYTPIIEEFHIGFEYERLSMVTWEKCIIEKEDFISSGVKSDFEFHVLEDLDNIRVKYLDREDIESLDWKFDINITNLSLRFTIGDIKLIWHSEDGRIRIGTSTNDQRFDGVIKNKSELNRLMKQLGIV